MNTMGKVLIAALVLAVVLLSVQVTRISRRLNSMQDLAQFNRIQARSLELRNADGTNVGKMTPSEVTLSQGSQQSDVIRVGVSHDGPYLKLIAAQKIGEEPEALIELGTVHRDTFGLNITGRDTWPGLGIGWAGSGAGKPNQYFVRLDPEDTGAQKGSSNKPSEGDVQ